jgi:hypothetical protein
VPVAIGTIKVLPARGYRKLARPLARRYLDGSRARPGEAGVPAGNGLNLGLVASSGSGGLGEAFGLVTRRGKRRQGKRCRHRYVVVGTPRRGVPTA